ncbi:MAG TPA: peptidyl-prolyl cis-trans isomerase [Bacteroidota bacterium]|nr:peptidyl-prolyl cis-trans isomerase [Bacteroidota bacterium]
MNRAAHFSVSIAAFVALSCSQRTGQSEEIARVDDQTLTREKIHEFFDSTAGISEVQMRMFARDWVNNEILYQEAKREGLDHSDAVLKNLEDARRQLAINALLDKEVFTESPQSISNAEAAAYFKTHAEEFALRDDIVELSLAVFAEREPAASFRETALEGGGWQAAATAAQAPVGGKTALVTKTDSAFFTQSSLFPPKLWKVATALGPGEVSFPVKTSSGYFVLMLIGSYAHGATPPLEYVADAIKSRLVMQHRQERIAEFLEAARKRHTVQVNISGGPSGKDTTSAPGE